MKKYFEDKEHPSLVISDDQIHTDATQLQIIGQFKSHHINYEVIAADILIFPIFAVLCRKQQIQSAYKMHMAKLYLCLSILSTLYLLVIYFRIKNREHEKDQHYRRKSSLHIINPKKCKFYKYSEIFGVVKAFASQTAFCIFV